MAYNNRLGLVAGDQPQLSHPGDYMGRMPSILGFPADTQNAVNQYAAMPPAQAQPHQLKTWQKILGTIGDGLQAAGGGKGTFMPAYLQQQDDLQNRTDEERKWQATLALKMQEANQPTAEMRNFGAYQQMDEPTRAMFDSYHRGDPNVTMTLPNDLGIYSGPQSGLAGALKGVAQGTPAKPVGRLTPIEGPPVGAPSMRPDAAMMQRLYVQQFGPAQGMAMFNEWASKTGNR